MTATHAANPVNELKITVEYTRTPPLSFVSKLRQFVIDNRDPPGCHVSLHWVEKPQEPPAQQEVGEQQETQREMLAHPRGYRRFPRYPRLRGEGHCPHCLCSPCAIILPPDFLIGSCDAHPANAEKRHDLYRKFWRLLNDLGVWRDPEYLMRKERRTVRDDRREIMPTCITTEVRRRYPSHDGEYTDYMSTFDAELC